MFGVNKVYDFVNKVYGMNKQSLLRTDKCILRPHTEYPMDWPPGYRRGKTHCCVSKNLRFFTPVRS